MEILDHVPTVDIQPVEEYLSKIICVEKLALYQPILDLLAVNEQFSYLDAINMIVEKVNDDGATDKLDQIHSAFNSALTDCIAQFDVIVSGGGLKLLTNIYHALTLLDKYEASEHIVNICNDDSLDQTDKLYEIISLIHKVDDQDFYNCVQVTAISLIDKIREIHDRRQIEQEEETYVPVEIDVKKVQTIKALAAKHPSLMFVSMVKNGVLVMDMVPDTVTDIVREYFKDYDAKDAKHTALELTGLFLISNCKVDELHQTIKAQLPILISNDSLVMAINAVLSAAIVEVTSYVEA